MRYAAARRRGLSANVPIAVSYDTTMPGTGFYPTAQVKTIPVDIAQQFTSFNGRAFAEAVCLFFVRRRKSLL